MKLIVGLGNPGAEYTRTRHNAGFMVIDRLAGKHAPGAPAKSRFFAATYDAAIGGEKCVLIKPTTYMNRSGQSVAEAVRFYKADPIQDLLVVVDDLYLPVGTIRVRPGGGTGGHNGLASIRELLGTDDYSRLRIGVGVRPNGGKPAVMDQADFVLSRFGEEDEAELGPALTRAVEAAECFMTRGLQVVLNTYNADPKRPARPSSPRPEKAPGNPPTADSAVSAEQRSEEEKPRPRVRQDGPAGQ